MVDQQENGLIVVGIDGSDSSLAALEWALNSARRRNAKVVAVTGFDILWTMNITPLTRTTTMRGILKPCWNAPQHPRRLCQGQEQFLELFRSVRAMRLRVTQTLGERIGDQKISGSVHRLRDSRKLLHRVSTRGILFNGSNHRRKLPLCAP